MSLKPTIFKAHLNIADIDHNHYQDHAITMARHPSETDERMMVRLAAYALQAHQLQDLCGGDGKLEFGKGLSDPDEPDVLLTDFTDAKRLWVEVGQPDDKPMAKACSKADSVVVYAYDHAADVWWQGVQGKVARLAKLQVWRIPSDLSQALAALAERSMKLQVTIQEGAITISSNLGSVYIEPIRWK